MGYIFDKTIPSLQHIPMVLMVLSPCTTPHRRAPLRDFSLRLVLPTVRASIENACARVARGEAHKSRVVEPLGSRFV